MKLPLCKYCNSELTRGKKHYICEECMAQFPFEEIEPQTIEAWERDVLENYPTMISVPFKEQLHATDIISREKKLIDTFTNILKFLSLIILTDYLLSNLKDRNINDKIKSLYTPKISDWNEFLRTSLPILERERVPLSIPEILYYFKNIESEISKKNKILHKNGYYNSEGVFVRTKEKLGFFSALISYRNSIAHGVGSENSLKIEKFNEIYLYFEKILSDLNFLIYYQMYANHNGNGILLKGTLPTFTDLVTSKLDPLKVSIFLINPKGGYKPLSPLFINGNIAIKNPTENLLGKYNHFICDKITDKRIFYVSPEGIELRTEITIEYWKKLLKGKQEDISLIQLNNFSIEDLNTRVINFSRNAISEYYTHSKLIKDIYLKRSLEEAKIKSFLSSPSSIAILTSEGGGGKSYLLGKFIEENLSTETILFLNAGDLEHVTFKDSLINILHLESSFFNNDLPPTFSLKIFLDGVNERRNPKDYLIDIVNFIQKYSNHFKILVSYRLNLDGTLPQIPHELNSNEIFYPGGSEEQFQKEGLDRIAIHLEKLQNYEIDTLWDLYKQRKRSRLFDEIFPNRKLRWVDYEELTNPLIFRIFCSIYDEKNLPRNFNQSMLWEKYLNILDEEISGSSQLLLNLTQFMLERKQYSIDYDSLLSHPLLQVDFKKTQFEAIWVKLLSKGILFRKMEDDNQIFKISIEPLMDYLTGEVMISLSPDLKSIEKLMQGEKYPPFQRGLVYYFSNCIQINNLNLLSQFIDSTSIEDVSIPAKALAEFYRYEKELTSKGVTILNSILSIQTENDAVVILIIVKILKENLNMIVSDKILEYFIMRYKKENWEYVEVLLEYVSRDNLSVSLKLDIIHKAINLSNILNLEDEKKAKLNFSIGRVFQEGDDTQYAIDFCIRSLKLYSKLGGKYNLQVAEIKILLGDIYKNRKDFHNSAKYYNESYNIITNLYGKNYYYIASILNKFGMMILSINEEILKLKDDSSMIRAINMGNFNKLLSNIFKFNDELSAFRKAFSIIKNIYGENHPYISESYFNIGNYYKYQKIVHTAINCYKKSINIFKNIYGEFHPFIALNYIKIAECYHSDNLFNSAIKTYKRVLNIYEELFGRDNPKFFKIEDKIADVYLSMGKSEIAYNIYFRTREKYLLKNGLDHYIESTWASNLANYYYLIEEPKRSLEFNEFLISLYEVYDLETHIDLGIIYKRAGDIYIQLNDYSQGIEAYGLAVKIYSHNFGVDHFSASLIIIEIDYELKTIQDKEIHLDNLTLFLEFLPKDHSLIKKFINIYKNKFNEDIPIDDNIS